MKASRQGQRAGRCSVQRRAVRVSRPGSAISQRRIVRAVRQVESSRPSCPTQRERLWARQAITVQARVGGEAAGGEVGERLVLEVADRELDLGVLAMLGVDRVHALAPGW